MDPINILVVADASSSITTLQAAFSNPAYRILWLSAHRTDILDFVHEQGIELIVFDLSSSSKLLKPNSLKTLLRDRGQNIDEHVSSDLGGCLPRINKSLRIPHPALFYVETVEDIPELSAYGGLEWPELGPFDYLYQPFSPSIVDIKVSNLIELHRKTQQFSEQKQRLASVDHQMAQQRQALVGQLTAGIAHDFNNILAVITLYCQLLQKSPASLKHTQYLDTIYQQANRGADLISQLLDFGRQSLMQPKSIDLVPFLDNVVELLSRTFPENIEVTFVSQIDSLYVRVDPTHLQQVFMNLAINARDAISGDGNFRLSLSAIDIRDDGLSPLQGLKPGLWAKVIVTDDGCGMSDEVIGRIFDPFFTTKGPNEGTGLGLAQVHGIIQQLSGEIEVTSSVGAGSTFTVYLPIDGLVSVPLIQDHKSEPAKPANELEQKVILLAEDEPSVRMALYAMFEELGFRTILAAKDGQEALALFRNRTQPIDLVFSDMVMPKMGGLELFEELRDEAPDIKMIISTGYPLENGGDALLERGVTDWILKPFTVDDVSEKIARALEL